MCGRSEEKRGVEGAVGVGVRTGRRLVGEGEAMVSIRAQNLSKDSVRGPRAGDSSHGIDASPGREWRRWYILKRTCLPEEVWNML